MRIRHLLVALLALPLLFAACEPDKPEPVPGYVYELTLTSEATMEFEAEGGEGTITFTAEKKEVTRYEPVPEPVVEAICKAEWVTDLTVDENITFTVAANEGDARETEIVVSYDDKSFEVKVRQAALGEDPKPEPAMEVELAAAARIPSSELDLADNYFVLAFADDAENVELGIVLVGAEGETILQTGEYASNNGTLLAEACELYVWEPEGEYSFAEGEAIVTLEGETYAFLIDLADADGKRYIFTYEGVVADMEPSTPDGPVAFTPEKVTAEKFVTGNFMLQLYFENGTRYHELDMFDEFAPNDNYLSEGVYKYSNGSIGTWSVFSNNPATTCSLADAEITLSHNDDKSVTLVGFISSEEGDYITIDWTGVVEGFNFGGNEPEVEEFSAPYFGGTYYEPYDGVTHNYYFALADAEITGDYSKEGATYFYFDVYTTAFNDDYTIPNGVYTFDMTNSYASGTFTEEYGFAFNIVNNSPVWMYYDEGSTLTVSDNKIVADLYFLDGRHIVVTYEGDISLGGGNEELTGDLEFDETGWTVLAEYYDQWYSDDTDNYYVSLYEDVESGSGGYFVLDLLADFATSVDYRGTFTASNSYGINTFVPGYIEDGYLAGSWYAEISGGAVSGVMAPLTEGTITVTFNDDGTKTFEFDCLDDAGNKITGSVTAGPYAGGYALSANKAKAHTVKAAKSVFAK